MGTIHSLDTSRRPPILWAPGNSRRSAWRVTHGPMQVIQFPTAVRTRAGLPRRSNVENRRRLAQVCQLIDENMVRSEHDRYLFTAAELGEHNSPDVLHIVNQILTSHYAVAPAARVSRSRSSVIANVDYSAIRQDLVVTFQSGRQYVYQGVPEYQANALAASDSWGRYFNRHIRGRYPSVRV